MGHVSSTVTQVLSLTTFASPLAQVSFSVPGEPNQFMMHVTPPSVSKPAIQVSESWTGSLGACFPSLQTSRLLPQLPEKAGLAAAPHGEKGRETRQSAVGSQPLQ